MLMDRSIKPSETNQILFTQTDLKLFWMQSRTKTTCSQLRNIIFLHSCSFHRRKQPTTMQICSSLLSPMGVVKSYSGKSKWVTSAQVDGADGGKMRRVEGYRTEDLFPKTQNGHHSSNCLYRHDMHHFNHSSRSTTLFLAPDHRLSQRQTNDGLEMVPVCSGCNVSVCRLGQSCRDGPDATGLMWCFYKWRALSVLESTTVKPLNYVVTVRKHFN